MRDESQAHLRDVRVVVEVAAKEAHHQRRRARGSCRKEGAQVGQRAHAPRAGLRRMRGSRWAQLLLWPWRRRWHYHMYFRGHLILKQWRASNA